MFPVEALLATPLGHGDDCPGKGERQNTALEASLVDNKKYKRRSIHIFWAGLVYISIWLYPLVSPYPICIGSLATGKERIVLKMPLYSSFSWYSFWASLSYCTDNSARFLDNSARLFTCKLNVKSPINIVIAVVTEIPIRTKKHCSSWKKDFTPIFLILKCWWKLLDWQLWRLKYVI